jgi:hypothetical protein
MKNFLFLIIIFLVLPVFSYGQNNNRFPIWTFHEKDVNIYGISVGLVSTMDERNTNTNGIRLELIGLGILIPMMSKYPDFGERRSERINGLNLSALGTTGNCLTNGISAGFGQLIYQVNGISLAMFMNLTHIQNGIMVSCFNVSHTMNGLQLGFMNFNLGNGIKVNGVQIAVMNESEKMNGLQIGIHNESKNLKGIQIGIWNVNQKRKLPLINWNFKRTDEQE